MISAIASSPTGNHHELPADVVVPTLEDHLCWLREAGFAEVDCVWKQFSEMFCAGSAAHSCGANHWTAIGKGICTTGLVAR